MFTAGGIYRFYYLWAMQKARGEESGRKARPACLLFKLPAADTALLLFPITASEPGPERLALEIPVLERKRANLTAKSWLILDEYNRTKRDTAFDFESLEPIGHFSQGFLTRIAETLKENSKTRTIKGVRRS
jgi:hypothetical protein